VKKRRSRERADVRADGLGLERVDGAETKKGGELVEGAAGLFEECGVGEVGGR